MKKLLPAFIVVLAACSQHADVMTNQRTNGTTTTVPPIKQVTIVSVGDISCSQKQRNNDISGCADQNVAKLVKLQKPDYVFALGDIQYPSHGYEDFAENFSVYWRDLLSITKPIPGNHEYGMAGAKGYYESWKSYSKPGYYSFDINEEWHVIALNTNDECKYVRCDKNSDQYNWVEEDLKKNSGKCFIAMGHQPRYSSGAHGTSESVKDIYDLFSSYSVEVYLSGHDHNYERISAPVTQFVVGTGGKELRGASKSYLGKGVESLFISSKNHGVLITTVFGSWLMTKFVTVDGEVIDQYSQKCDSRKPPSR